MQHTGGCHCGKVKYSVEMDIDKVLSCNCSMCSKRGTLLAFAPITNFKLLSGASDLATYTFNKHMIHHKFCKTCGILSFAEGEDPKGNKMAAINVRCLDNIDLDKLEIMKIDGKNF